MLYLDFSFFAGAELCVKMSKKGVFSGPYFPAFEMNTERYFVLLRIQSKCGKYGPEKTPHLDTFHTVAGTARTSEGELRKNKLQLQAYFISNTFISNARLKLAENQASKLSNTLWLNCCYLKIIRFLHPRYH